MERSDSRRRNKGGGQRNLHNGQSCVPEMHLHDCYYLPRWLLMELMSCENFDVVVKWRWQEVEFGKQVKNFKPGLGIARTSYE